MISDGIVEEFAGQVETPVRTTKSKGATKGRVGKQPEAETVDLSPQGEILAARLREWRAIEAKRLRVPAYVVMHDRTLTAVARMRPGNPRELLEIDGIGPAKVEKFGPAILGLCRLVP